MAEKYGIRFKSRMDKNDYTAALREQGIRYTERFDASPPHQDNPYLVMPNKAYIDDAIDTFYSLQATMADIKDKEKREERKTESKKEKHKETIERGEITPKQTFEERKAARPAGRYGIAGKAQVMKRPVEEIPARVKEQILMPAFKYGFSDIEKGLAKAKRPPDPLSGMKRAIPVSAAERHAAGHREYKYFGKIGAIGATKITDQAVGTGTPAIAGVGRTPIAELGASNIASLGRSNIAETGETTIANKTGRPPITNYKPSPSMRFSMPRVTRPPSVREVTGNSVILKRDKEGEE